MAGLHITEVKKRVEKKNKYRFEPFVCAVLVMGFAKVLLSGFSQISSWWWIYGIACVLLTFLLFGLDNIKHRDWIYLSGFGILLLILLTANRMIKNGLAILGNEWLAFLTGKTGKIYLDFPVQGDTGMFLVPAVILLFFTLCLIWEIQKNRFLIGGVALLICMTGCTFGFFKADYGIAILTVGVGWLFCSFRLAPDSNKSLFCGGESFLLITLGCMGIACVVGWGLKFQFHVDVPLLEVKTAIHEWRYDDGESVMPEGNLISPGPFEKSEETALAVTTEKPQKLYLRGMTGEVYTGISWEGLSEDTRKDGKELFYWMHQSGFYGQNTIGQAMGLKNEKTPVSMTIENISACSKYQYLPYAIVGDSILREDFSGDDENLSQGNVEELSCYPGSVPQWYETALWLSQNQGKEEVDSFLALEESYRNFVYENDLQLTNTAVGVLDQLFDGEEKTDCSLSEILELVRNTLNEKLKYREDITTFNGKNDFFKYTMEQSKSGYSVHYATAATLMLRYFGVPSRYVEGYYLSSEEAERYEAGDTIYLTKGNAHAWAEYYLDGIGWIPFEVTPGYIDEEELDAASQVVADGKGESEGKSYAKSSLTYKPPKQPEENEDVSNRNPHFRFQIKYLINVLLLFILLFILVIVYRILKRRKRLLCFYKEMEETDDRSAVTGLYGYGQMLLKRYQLSELESGENVQRINQEARFSTHEIPASDRQQVKQYTYDIIRRCKAEKGFWKKFRDHYLFWLYR